MGIMSFIKGGVAELAIARPDSAKDQWVYKHPDQTIPAVTPTCAGRSSAFRWR